MNKRNERLYAKLFNRRDSQYSFEHQGAKVLAREDNSVEPAKENLVDLALGILERAKASGASQADVIVAEGDTVSVQVRLSAVDQLTKAREKALGLRVFFGKRSASASTTDFSKDSLHRLVADTCDLAKAVAEDPFSGLPDEAVMTTKLPDLDLYDPTSLSVDQQIQLARQTEEAAMEWDPRITNSEGAGFDTANGVGLLANTHGFHGMHQSSSFSLAVTPIASDSNGSSMQRDSWYSINRKFERLESPESIGQEAARRAVRRLGGRKIQTQQVPIIFDPETAGSLLSHLAGAVSGYALYKGASFLLEQLGKRLAPDFVSVYDDGRILGGLGSRPFDGEGVPTGKTTVLENGVLISYLLDTYSGKKLSLSSTGNASRGIGDNPTVAPTNFYLGPGTTDPQEIIRSVRRGIYVTELIGFGVNMVTGDYSRGAGGFWIENGELAYPVEEITIAGNLKDMFAGIEVIGNDLQFRSRIASPTIKIHTMTVAGS